MNNVECNNKKCRYHSDFDDLKCNKTDIKLNEKGVCIYGEK